MTFTSVVEMIKIMSIVGMVTGVFLVVLGETRWGLKNDYIGLWVGIIFLVVYFFHVPVMTSVFNKDVVGVKFIETSEGIEYYEVTVPKEDESIILSKKYSVNELKDKYNVNYDGERYVDEEDVIIIELDPTVGYEIRK